MMILNGHCRRRMKLSLLCVIHRLAELPRFLDRRPADKGEQFTPVEAY